MTGLASLFDNSIARGTRPSSNGHESLLGEMSTMNAVPSHDQSTKRSQDLTCPRCQRGYLTDRHCKSVCELCGYVESCEDIFPTQPAARSIDPIRFGPDAKTSGRRTPSNSVCNEIG